MRVVAESGEKKKNRERVCFFLINKQQRKGKRKFASFQNTFIDQHARKARIK